MEKNMIWAIVLTSLIIIASAVLQPIFLPGMSSSGKNKAKADKEVQTAEIASVNSSAGKDAAFSAAQTDEPEIQEQTITIKTKRIKAEFTNRGGDITGYELLDHIDTDTKKGIQMADNVSAMNRACSLSLGGVDQAVLNGLFTVTQPDPYTVLFTKNINIQNADGSNSKFVLGKRYTFKPDEYAFKLEILIHGDDGVNGINYNNAAYTLRTSPQIGPHYDAKLNKYEVRQFLAYNGSKEKKISVGSKQFKEYDKEFNWAGIAGKYFEELVIPEKPDILSKSYYSSRVEVNDYSNAQALFVRKSFTGSNVHDTYYLYFGPREEKELSRYNTVEKNGWNLSNMKLNESLQSSGWLAWLEIILKWMMEILYKLIPNWGISIILMTVILKVAMFPLTKKQSLSTLKMQELQPQIQTLQTKYKDNPQKLQTEMANIYKANGYNPASGCLPMLLQFLVIFAMYNLFNNYFEFRGASFISGWIPDLSAGDSIHTFKRIIPFFGNQFRILPIIYLASQLFYGKITQNGGTTAVSGTSATQMKFMMYGMPIIFFFIFYNAPSGLLLYWTVSNIIQMGQQMVINKIMEEKKTEILKLKKGTISPSGKKHGSKR
jgi:YidC/Oxa1 family membrane protein insertase